MKKRTLIILMIILSAIILSFPAYAANQVSEIDVDVTLEQDGSAYVLQRWDGSFDEGTECYFPVTNLGGMTISGLTVSDGNRVYNSLEQWDTGASFEEKSGSCGLNQVEGGYEVCWGITQYGQNRYAVEYRLEGLLAGYDDSDGFLFQFVPDNMNSGPTDVTVRIHTRDGQQLTEENTAIWAFGFQGQIGFSDGGILAYTESPVTENNSVIIMMQLNKGILSPARTEAGSFEAVKNRAFEGSSYLPDEIVEDNEEYAFIYMLLGILIVAGAGGLIYHKGAGARKIKKLYKKADYWREPPFGGNLEAAFMLGSSFHQSDEEGDLIAAALIRLLSEGCLEPSDETNIGFMGREKKSVSLRLIKAPSRGGLTARLLYDLLEQAAGSDGILQEQELENYCKTNYSTMFQILNEAKRDGEDTLYGINCYQPSSSRKNLKGLTDRGMRLLLQLIGYKKYLLDFSLIAERGVDEALIWRDCLTFAALFGVADKVLKQLRQIYPANVSTSFQQIEAVYYTAYRYHHITYDSAKSAKASGERISGRGGFSSLGGGGGFSGGGSGGGTR